MKLLSDYKDEEAIELWADLLDPLSVILSDKDFTSGLKGKSYLVMAKDIMKKYSHEAVEILKRIDPDEIDGMNLLLRLVNLLADIGRNKEIMGFFGSSAQEMSESESFGSATENTEDGEN